MSERDVGGMMVIGSTWGLAAIAHILSANHWHGMLVVAIFVIGHAIAGWLFFGGK